MESSSSLVSALSVGLGVGLGLGLATGSSKSFQKLAASYSSANYQELMELELMNLVVDGRSCNVTFDEFPYFLSERTKALLTSAAFLYLKEEQFSKYTRNLSPASRSILLSGYAEPYNQMLAKALAYFFEAKLVLLDATDFCLKLQRKHGAGSENDLKAISESAFEKVSSIFDSFSIFPSRAEQTVQKSGLRRQNSGVETRLRSSEGSSSASDHDVNRGSNAANHSSIKRANSWSFDDKLLIQSLSKVLFSVSKNSPVILYMRDVDKLLFRGPKTMLYFSKMIKQLSGPILILGSRIQSSTDKTFCGDAEEKISQLFPYTIDAKLPEDDAQYEEWKSKLDEDVKAIAFQDNKNHVSEILAANDVECDDLGNISFGDTEVLSSYIEEIVTSAISHHLMNTQEPNYRSGRLIISSQSLAHGLSIFQAGHLGNKDNLQMENNGEDQTNGKVEAKMESPTMEGEKKDSTKGESIKKEGDTKDGNATAPPKPEVLPDNDFEKRIRSEVIPAGKIGVTFEDIGALDHVKESLQELVMLPLKRPDLFKGGLLKPCRGILLFGPPGTGKTMLAKALATEANASFINVTMSTVTSKWFGEDEKIVRALFSLAAKVSPTIIFIDEVDSMLGQRSRVGEHEAMRKIKNEFMAHWDGLLSKSGERVLVLAATNRPFDLDEAIIRRFQRRIMVGLPNVESREKILRTLLSKENLEEGFDFKELAVMTEGYTGSDLKNICTEAAFRPIRELLNEEKAQEKAMKESAKKAEESEKEQGESSNKNNASPKGDEKQEEENEEASLKEEGKQEKEKEKKPEQEKEIIEKEEKEKGKEEGIEAKNDVSIALRALTMEDLKQAKNQISASFASDGFGMNELKEWNEMYGEGGSRKKQAPTYFL